MEDERPDAKKGTRSALASERTGLALRRTVLAADRTLLAWVRTSLSLMTFGFTIYKFFQYLEESGAVAGGWRPDGPRRFALVLITLATVLLAAQTWQYYTLLKRLSQAKQRKVPKTPSLLAGFAVVLIGVIAFLNVFLRARLF
jgi:putative membrane protein